MSENGSNAQDALRTAASAAVVGAAVGAARAYSARRHREEDDAPEETPVEPETEEVPGTSGEEPVHEPVHEPEPVQASNGNGDLREAVARARRILDELRGVEPESVSSVVPTRDGWVVGLEVVEVRRIPDSTDILASYEVEVDGDGGVRKFERVRRYHRSEAGGAS